MAQLRQDYAEFVARGAEVIAVGPEDPDVFARWWRGHAMPFVGLADPRHVVAGQYGQEMNLLKLGRLPAQFVIDRQGTIQYSHHSISMADIPPNAEILEILDKLNRKQASS